MGSPDEDVYATLLLNDSYLPGALVLAHSLKDAGTKKKLAVLITPDTVSKEVIKQLETVYDYTIAIDRVVNQSPANLFVMGRPDLHSTFTKIALWKLTQFRKVVYVDADIVAIRAPDELFDIPHPFSAAPDIGWPDIFNTGVMVLTPNMGDYYALQAMAQRGISFDGADQGLLNMHFKNTYNRISFTYNVTPSAHYQYLPAYRHFQSSISMAHFIGQNKPWKEGREAHKGSTPYDEMVGRWWAVYDRHYRESSAESSSGGSSTIVHYLTKGEFQPVVPVVVIEAPPPSASENVEQTHSTSESSAGEDVEGSSKSDHSQQTYDAQQSQGFQEQREQSFYQSEQGEAPKERQPEYHPTWDASKAPPPADSRPEASNFPSTHYDMSSDPTPWVAPVKYPDPPKDMWYEVPKTPTHQKLAPIFPWEKYADAPTRAFPEDKPSTPEIEIDTETSGITPNEDDKPSPVTPTTPTISLTPADSWGAYTRGNAWDDIPEIERYIGNLQKNRKGKIQVLQGSESSRKPSIKLTDFPTELERPSLPVTPAPIRRPSFWGAEKDEEGEFPVADGVPSQEEWDPVEKLEQLARRQSEVLERKLGEGVTREIPTRPLPYGSEGVQSPTYVKQEAPLKDSSVKNTDVEDSSIKTTEVEDSSVKTTDIEEPSFHGAGAQWEKDEVFPTAQRAALPSEEERDVLET